MRLQLVQDLFQTALGLGFGFVVEDKFQAWGCTSTLRGRVHVCDVVQFMIQYRHRALPLSARRCRVTLIVGPASLRSRADWPTVNRDDTRW